MAPVRKPDSQYDEKRMELTEHLGELRTRIIRSIWYLVLGAFIAYQFFGPLYGLLYRPLAEEMSRQNKVRARIVDPTELLSKALSGPTVPVEDYNRLQKDVQNLRDNPPRTPVSGIVFRNFHEPFMVRLKISIVYGFILVMPFVVWELAQFIVPALTPQERRPLRLLVPLSICLLMLGIAVAYRTMFFAMHWFLSYLDDFPQPAVLQQDPNDYILFFVKMMAAFGIAFQLPVVLMGGAFAGFVKSKWLIKNWRVGVLIAALGGLFTPSNDLPSMALMSIPLLLLYFLSIALVRFVERIREKSPPASS